VHHGGSDALRRTLASLADATAAARLVAVEDGAQHETAAGAVSALVTRLTADPDVDVILSVSDDWIACTLVPWWLGRGCQVLERDSWIGQVRLGHRSEPVLGRHMVTGRPIAWRRTGDVLRSDAAHLTLKPNLLRAADAATRSRARTSVRRSGGSCAPATARPSSRRASSARPEIRPRAG
jgi:hypothetical protein